jgi:hypothetical protein
MVTSMRSFQRHPLKDRLQVFQDLAVTVGDDRIREVIAVFAERGVMIAPSNERQPCPLRA